MPYRIPIGPYHPSLEEPYKTTLHCEGEKVKDVDIEIGFNFRSVELLAQRKNYIQNLVLIERICGICSCVHTLTYCMAIERLAGIQVPPRAQYIRVIMAELERMHSHLLWTGVAAEQIGFQTLFMEVFYLRELVMDILEAISGNRVNYSMNTIGGVNRDIEDTQAILSALRDTRSSLEKNVVPAFMNNRTVQARAAGVGILTREKGIELGVVGPVARASGINEDTRLSFPYAAYGELGFQMATATEGDVVARLVVRALEMQESMRLIEQALRHLPTGPIHNGQKFSHIPAGEATARAEAPRGEVFYYIASNGSDSPTRLKVRTPTFMTIPAVRTMSAGQELSDMPLIQAALDPCYSCTDR